MIPILRIVDTDVDTIIVGKATHAMGLAISHDIIHSVIVMRLANTLNGEPSKRVVISLVPPEF